MPKTTSKAAFGAKSQFVRSKPDITAQEVVELAKKQGIKLTASHVYNIRANDKKKNQGGSKSPVVKTSRKSKAKNGLVARANRSNAPAPLEGQFRTLVLRMGLDRAEQIFSELKSTLSTDVRALMSAPVRMSSNASSAPSDGSSGEAASHPN